MSTTPVESWAVDLAEVTFIHPFAGWEVLMVIIGVVLWIGWHVWQIRYEDALMKEEMQKYANAENIKNAIDAG